MGELYEFILCSWAMDIFNQQNILRNTSSFDVTSQVLVLRFKQKYRHVIANSISTVAILAKLQTKLCVRINLFETSLFM